MNGTDTWALYAVPTATPRGVHPDATRQEDLMAKYDLREETLRGKTGVIDEDSTDFRKTYSEINGIFRKIV